ncbi:amino acid adenylation domain-containing protein [Kitasatospora sp. NPDC092039]|uniref:amino acid adenylation domain-containing protein n=1 Tax=Kitasatospora sp. NPDC092039 TaxID=3364086 RepID=UPI00381D8CCA
MSTAADPAAITRRSRPDRIPLSFAQERLWFLEQLVPGTAVQNVPLAARLRGRIDADVLRRAVDAVVRRHEVLRTVFESTDGVPHQRVLPALEIPLDRHDLAHLPEPEREPAGAARLAELAAVPFDLTRPPLLRAALVRHAEDDHTFLLVLHHIVSDGWSVGVLMRELSAAIAAAAAGADPGLPELPVQYADFALWQRDRQAAGAFDRDLAYWRERLGATVPPLELPMAAPRTSTSPAIAAGGRVSLDLGPELTAALDRLGRAERATPYMTLLAAYVLLLHRHSGPGDERSTLVVGTPIANRNQVETEDLIGFFVNALALRFDLAEGMDFRALLRHVRKVAIGAFAHQDVPFEKLVEELRPERRMSQAPLFQTMFVLQNAATGAARLPGLEITPVDVHTATAKFDLLLAVTPRDGSLHATLEFDATRFDADTARRLLDRYRVLLESAVADPGADLAALPMLPAAERAELLHAGRRRAVHPGAATLHGLFAEQAARTPDRIAVSHGDEHLSYAALDARAAELAGWLTAAGVRPGQRVALFLDRSTDTVAAILAVLRTGAAYVPMDAAYPTARLHAILRDARPALVLTQRRMLGQLPDGDAPVLCVDDPGEAPSAASGAPAVTGDPDAGAYVIYTSGSTGTPKGVLISHRNVVRLFEATRDLFSFGQDDVWTMFHSYAFDFAVWEMWGALLHGGRVVVVPTDTARSAEAYYALVRDERVTVLNQTPSAFVHFAAVDAREDAELALRAVVFGGEALELGTLRQWIARHGDDRPRLVNMYGITETTVHVTHRTVRAADLDQPGRSPIGEPLPDLELYVLDGTGAQLVPYGVPGELHVGGAGLAAGYLGDPDRSAQRFVPHPFAAEPGARLYRTGDLAQRLPSGDIEYLGRIDHQVKIRGFRIETGEIEAGLLAHPAVTAAVVTPHQAEDGDRRLVAYLVADPAAVAADAPADDTSFDDAPEAASETAARAQIDEWELVFDGMYGSQQGTLADDFDITGWNSTYTNEPLPAEQMREWVDTTVAAISALEPRRVLEIGCGTGLLLQRLAPAAVDYTGTDLSAGAVAALKSRVGADHVTLLHQSADVVEGLPTGHFDTVVLNSVAQYFPDVHYLTTVLTRAASILPDDAVLFVGDLRDLRLLEAFHLSVELFRADDDMPLTRLREQIARRILEEDELLCDPGYFHALRQVVPRLGAVEIRPRRGRHRNEMSCFRYDAVLHLGAGPARAEQPAADWAADAGDRAGLERLLATRRAADGELRVAAVPNPRTAAELRALELLAAAGAGATVLDLRRELDRATAAGMEIEDVQELAERLGHRVRFEWNAERAGAYDAVFTLTGTPAGPAPVETPAADAPAADAPAPAAEAAYRDSPASYANDPMLARRRRQLVPAVREFLKAKVPHYMVPSGFVVLDRLPLTPNGKVDRAALPLPDAERAVRHSGYTAPRTETERLVTELCAAVLGVDRVGAEDNFFELGGHSLLATRFVFRLGEECGAPVPLRVLFESPTMAGIAAAVDGFTAGAPGGAEPDLAAEVRLADDVAPAAEVVTAVAEPREVLLTGATGFLGAFLLRELLTATDARVHCLVRGADGAAARERLLTVLDGYGLRGPALPEGRISVLAGDLARPRLGLTEERFDALARTVDAVYHAGASVNLVYPYAELKAANVTGTEEVLRLAARHRTVPVHHVSTIGVFGASAPVLGGGGIAESAPTGPAAELGTGYTRSKWVAEEVVGLARRRGLPVSVYRPSRISGDTRTGACQRDDYLWRVLKGCVQAGAAPADATMAIDLVPVDYVAGALVAASRRTEAANGVYHLTNERRVPLARMLDHLREYGYELAEVPFAQWCEAVGADPENAAYPLLGVLTDTGGGVPDALFDASGTERALAGTGVVLPVVDRALVTVYLDWFVRTGYLPAPGAR